jgi:uncharacterized protein YkwD
MQARKALNLNFLKLRLSGCRSKEMKNVESTAFWKILVIIILLLAVAHVPAQTPQNRNQKPKAIISASWSEPDSIFATNTPKVSGVDRTHIVAAGFENSFDPNSSANISALKPNDIEQEVFNLINEQRRLKNLSPLEFDAKMLYLARQHSANMAQFKFFSHKGLDGLTVEERAQEVGISEWRAIGENIAFSQNAAKPAEVAIQSWMNSEGHRRNIFNSTWTRSGIGVATTPDGKFYVTQVFIQ